MAAQPANEDHVHFQLYHQGKLTDPEKFLNDPENQKQFGPPAGAVVPPQ